MKNLAALNKYFVKYKWRLLLGILFTSTSNLFTVMQPDVVKKVLDVVQKDIEQHVPVSGKYILECGLLLLGLAIMRGIFMFFMRQTIIVMSRHIEFDQKNEIFNHYQKLHSHFFKTHFTGDMMNRLSEDVSRVRMYIGPAIMYATNLVTLTVLCLWYMFRVNVMLTLYVIAPLPLLALSVYLVNSLIYKKSERIQSQLSGLTSTAQESYSGIRVIKSFVQELNMMRFFNNTSEEYRKSTINLSLTESIYFPSITFFTSISILSIVLVGGYLAIHGGGVTVGEMGQFILYITLLMFPISSIGMVASIIQRANVSQTRINEFLHTEPEIQSPANAIVPQVKGKIDLDNITFTYPHTGITALKDFTLQVAAGQKVAVIGGTGSGKSTIAHMLLRMYDVQQGEVLLDDITVTRFDLQELRRQIAYAPQEAFLFSDTVYNNIKFGNDNASEADVKEAARLADLEKDIATFAKGYETVIGERGVMLSGGQKQRMVLARALVKNSKILMMDDSLSAVDTQTEKTILQNLLPYLEDKTAIVITHRIFTGWHFDKIIVLDNGKITEQGNHAELMELNGRYAKLFRHQTETNSINE
jgi:ATP-binding cassette subfamily B protein